MNHLTKIDATGAPLPPDATEWPIVLCDSLVARAMTATDGTLGKGIEYFVPDVGRKSFDDAVAYGEGCELYGGGWQLASRQEEELILDLERYEPAVDPAFFPTIRSAWYWTRTPAAWSPGSSAWIVNFVVGHADVIRRDYGYRVLLARPRQ